MKHFVYSIGILFVVLASCTKMDDLHKDFIKDGPITYIGKVDSVQYFAGINTIKLKWKLSADPAIKTVRVYWLDEGVQDSISATVDQQMLGQYMEVTIPEIDPGAYTFFVVTFDDKGNRSVPVEVNGNVLNESIIGSLQPNVVSNARFAADVLTIEWLGNTDTTFVGSVVSYTAVDGSTKRVVAAAGDEQTVIDDYKEATPVEYYSRYYLPQTIDTLNTVDTRLPVRHEYTKDGWEATASGYDEPTGRGPWNAIDNNPASVWHMTKEWGYPHEIAVDMGAPLDLGGVVFQQRDNLDGPVVLCEVLVSNDGNEWESKGEYTLQSITSPQYLAFAEEGTYRHFKIIAKSDGKGGDFTAVAEVGAYIQW